MAHRMTACQRNRSRNRLKVPSSVCVMARTRSSGSIANLTCVSALGYSSCTLATRLLMYAHANSQQQQRSEGEVLANNKAYAGRT
jgi:hypothetical protein